MAVIDSIRKFASAGVRSVLHLGDFYLGIGSERMAKQRLSQTERWLREHDQKWFVTPGNHENWTRLVSKKVNLHGVLEFSERLAYLPRGTRWTCSGVTFLSVGGAPSINRDSLTPGKTWWAEEILSQEDVKRISADGQVDVLLAHDAPEPLTPKVARAVAAGADRWSGAAVEYAEQGRAMLTTILSSTLPRLVVHGHHHVADRAKVVLPGTSRETEIVSMARADAKRSAAILDLSAGAANLRVTTL